MCIWVQRIVYICWSYMQQQRSSCSHVVTWSCLGQVRCDDDDVWACKCSNLAPHLWQNTIEAHTQTTEKTHTRASFLHVITSATAGALRTHGCWYSFFMQYCKLIYAYLQSEFLDQLRWFTLSPRQHNIAAHALALLVWHICTCQWSAVHIDDSLEPCVGITDIPTINMNTCI